jgi:hypothetical protein
VTQPASYNGNGNGNGHGHRGAVRQLLTSLAKASAHEVPPPASRGSKAAWSEWEDLGRELNRSRRYERCFTLIRIAVAAETDRRKRFRGRSGPNGSLRAVASLVRSVDGVWTDETDVYLLLPECDRTTGERTLSRIESSLAGIVPAGSAITVASFPQDGRTSGALLNALHGRPIETIEAPPEPAPAISLVEEILARTVASADIPQDGAGAAGASLT